MKIGLPFLTQLQGSPEADELTDTRLDPEAGGRSLGGWTAQTIRQLVAQLTTGYHTQHNDNDTHSTITASGTISERGRTIPLGDWTDYQLTAAWFTAAGSMTWTVSATSFLHLRTMKIGSTLFVDFRIVGSTLGGGADVALRITLPENLVIAKDAQSTIRYLNGASSGGGEIRAVAGDTYIQLIRGNASNWDTASSADVMGQIALPISSSTATINQTTILADVLAVGGGGGGGQTSAGGGGGGGGQVSTLTGQSYLHGQSFTVTIGGGGAGGAVGTGDAGTDGSNTTFSSLLTGAGGKGGVGGASGTGNSGSGNAGGAGDGSDGGGGGGNGAVGGNADGVSAGGNGGAGTANTYSGSSLLYGAGGGGHGTVTGGTGGSSIGGDGSTDATVAPTNGATNRGAGGGGAGVAYSAGSGSAGVVIVRYLGAAVATGGTITTSGGYTIHTFTASGTFAL